MSRPVGNLSGAFLVHHTHGHTFLREAERSGGDRKPRNRLATVPRIVVFGFKLPERDGHGHHLVPLLSHCVRDGGVGASGGGGGYIRGG